MSSHLQARIRSKRSSGQTHFAHELVAERYSVTDMQGQLGHASLAMTQLHLAQAGRRALVFVGGRAHLAVPDCHALPAQTRSRLCASGYEIPLKAKPHSRLEIAPASKRVVPMAASCTGRPRDAQTSRSMLTTRLGLGRGMRGPAFAQPALGALPSAV